MPRCCGGASCSCVIQEGPHIQVVGTGSASDPFVIVGDVDVEVVDNSVFNLTLEGLGTVESPWTIEMDYAATATLNDLPDVNAPEPGTGEVLGWDSSLGQWTPRAPATAAPGAVLTDASLSGDGSTLAPLQAREDPDRMLATRTAGLGLSDTGMNSIVRRFADATARNAANPAPVTNSLSMLDSNQGQIDYWNGTAWGPAGMFAFAMIGAELVSWSGSYTGAQRVSFLVRNTSTITDENGVFDAIPASDLATKAGVLTAICQPTAASPSSIAVPFTVILAPEGSALRGVAYRLDDGTPVALSPIAVTVIALVY